MAGGHSIDALGQFELHPVLGSLGASLRFSQSNLMMVIASAIVLLLLYVGMRPRAIVPGRLQALAEILYDFIHTMTADQIGHQGRRFFPFVFTLFTFILVGNYLGLIPGSFTFTSHIVVTAGMAVLVFTVGLLVALREQGLGFFGHFLPEGAPKALAPLLVPIEILSYLSRPISLSVRLFANMMAGHVMFEMFAAFTVLLGGIHVIGPVLGIGPVVINMALIALELLVGGLQAYVFAILTCIYLREAVAHH